MLYSGDFYCNNRLCFDVGGEMKKFRGSLLVCIMATAFLFSGCGLLDTKEPEVYGSFVTTDLYGNEVTEEIFAESKLTVVNVWATYCGPCIQEMPYLGELAEEYDSAQVQIVGIPTDVSNQEYLEYALSIVEETGADYTHLLFSEELYHWGLSDIQYVPTTFFVDSNGKITDTVVGSMSKEDWKELIDSKLASM